MHACAYSYTRVHACLCTHLSAQRAIADADSVLRRGHNHIGPQLYRAVTTYMHEPVSTARHRRRRLGAASRRQVPTAAETGLHSYGLCSYSLDSYGLYSYGLHSCGLHIYGLHSYGLHSHGLLKRLFTCGEHNHVKVVGRWRLKQSRVMLLMQWISKSL